MDIIESFAEVLMDLKELQYVCTANKTGLTLYYLKNNKVHINNPSFHYSLTIDEFSELYSKETFYLYKENENFVNSEKDDEYYSWKSKGVN